MAINANAAKKRAKAHQEFNKVKDEPVIREDNYNVDIGTALVWYSDYVDDKKRRKYAIEYFAKQSKKPEVLALSKATDSEIRQIGALCRLVSNGNKLLDEHMALIESRVALLVAKYKVVKEKVVATEAVQTNVISIQQRMEEKAHELAGDIEGAIDDFVLSKGKTTFSTRNYLLANAVSAPVAKRIGELFTSTSAELHEAIAGEDDQLVEGYSNFTKRELKKFAEFVDTIIADCQQQVQTAKASRSPRKRKAVPPSKVVSKMKYLRDFAELNLKSCKPEDILSSTELWVYNTKYRKVQVYKAEMGSLSVKGTSILGFSLKDSVSLTLRKPEEFFKGLSLGKRALNNAIKSITTKPTKPNGRVNEECILLGAF
jgi:hypothetical protein